MNNNKEVKFKNNGHPVSVSILDIFYCIKNKCLKNDSMYSLTIILHSCEKIFVPYATNEEYEILKASLSNI